MSAKDTLTVPFATYAAKQDETLLARMKAAPVTNGRWDITGYLNGSRYILGNMSIALHWEEPGARFHVWCDANGKPRDEYIYKNCSLELNRGDAGYFNTRMLDPAKPVNVARIARALEQAGPFETARDVAHWVALIEAEQADKERFEARRAAKIKESGPALLEALEALLKALGGSTAFPEARAAKQACIDARFI